MLLAKIAILLYFFFLFLVFSSFFASPGHNENVRLRLALAIPTDIPITVANNAIEMLPFVPDKQLETYQNNQRGDIFAKSFTH